MSCGCSDNYNSNSAYNGYCNADTPYPSVSHESVPSLIDNLVTALYGEIEKDVSSGKVVWNIPCDPNNTAQINNFPRNTGEGLMCYLIRFFNTPVINNPTIIPVASANPLNNGDLKIEATSNTSLTFKLRGTDGVVRSASLALI